MKTFFRMRNLAALLGALGLAACGGYSSMPMEGNVSGLTTEGLVLDNGSETVSIAANKTTYRFPSELPIGASFNVTIKTQPQHATCTVANVQGTVGTTSTSNINVACQLNAYPIGGEITGLGSSTGLTLVNGTDKLDVAANATTFAMPKVTYGSAYGVTVWMTPTGLRCSVTNGTGTMADAEVKDIKVVCQPV